MNTPIALVIFNRPETTIQVFDIIKKIKPKQLFIIGDGPRASIQGEEKLVQEARNIVCNIDWDCDVSFKFSDVNIGSKQNISQGINWVFEKVDRAIFLDDDCLPAYSFFTYCEELLDKYEFDFRIGMISGLNYWSDSTDHQHDYVYSKYTLAWGWATWRNRWVAYDPYMKLWPISKKLNILHKIFPSSIEKSYWSNIFDQSYHDTNDAYDYPFVFTNLLYGRLCIYPSSNLISNIGFGPGATNTLNAKHPLANFKRRELNFPLRHPLIVMTDQSLEKLISRKFYGVTYYSFIRKKIRDNKFMDWLVAHIKYFFKNA